MAVFPLPSQGFRRSVDPEEAGGGLRGLARPSLRPIDMRLSGKSARDVPPEERLQPRPGLGQSVKTLLKAASAIAWTAPSPSSWIENDATRTNAHPSQSVGILAGKRGLVMGVANSRSMAWGIAKPRTMPAPSSPSPSRVRLLRSG